MEKGWNRVGKGVEMTEERKNMHEELARLVAGGMARKDAYRQAFGRPEMDDVTASKRASDALKKLESRRKMGEIRGKVAKAASEDERRVVYDKERRMRILSELVDRGLESGQPLVAINAIRELNKMDGSYEAQRVEVREDVIARFAEEQMRLAMREPLVRQRG